MLIYIHFFPEIEEHLKKAWGEHFEKGVQDMAEAFSGGLQSLRLQLGAVIRREGTVYADFAFKLGIKEDTLFADVYAYYTVHDRPDFLFPLADNKPYSIPFDFTFLLREDPSISRVGHLCNNAASRLASDFAREGLPVEMKRACADYAKFMRKAMIGISGGWFPMD